MKLDTVQARTVTADEIRALTPDDLIYVPDSDFSKLALVQARVTGRKITENKVEVRDVYGSTQRVAFSRTYVEDPDGVSVPVIPIAGSRLSSTLFFPGMDQEEVRERLFKAIRAEFGAGVVEAWNLRSSPVRAIRRNIYAVRRDRVPVAPKGKRGKTGDTVLVETSRRQLAQGAWDGHEQHFGSRLESGEELITEPYIEIEEGTRGI